MRRMSAPWRLGFVLWRDNDDDSNVLRASGRFAASLFASSVAYILLFGDFAFILVVQVTAQETLPVAGGINEAR